jgi:hypothetical protein
LIHAGGDRLKRIIVLSLILVASMFAMMFVTTAIATAIISIPKTNTISYHALPAGNVQPLGDPIDGGPPGFIP